MYDYNTWHKAYVDNNINVFTLLMHVNTIKEYIALLEKTLEKYIDEIKKLPLFMKEVWSKKLKKLSRNNSNSYNVG